MRYKLLSSMDLIVFGVSLFLAGFISHASAATPRSHETKTHKAIKVKKSKNAIIHPKKILHSETHLSPSAFSYSMSLPWSLEIGLGYGKYQNMLYSDGKTVLARIGIGKEIWRSKLFRTGMEVSVQTGNTSRLSIPSSTQALLGGLPVESTIKPMMDFLLTGKRYLSTYPTFYSQIKVGAIWRQWQFTRSTVNDVSKINTELQFGMGWDVNKTTSITLLYQHIFGGHPSFEVVSDDCIAHVSKIPIENSIILGLSINLDRRSL